MVGVFGDCRWCVSMGYLVNTVGYIFGGVFGGGWYVLLVICGVVGG